LYFSEAHNETPQPPPPSEIRQLITMVSQLSAVCNVRHGEVIQKMAALEKKITHMGRKLSARRSDL
jgi:hypothetical protein